MSGDIDSDNTAPSEDSLPRPGLEPHLFKMTPFVFGVAFAFIGIAGLSEFSSGDATGWLWVTALIVFGVGGVVAALGRRPESL